MASSSETPDGGGALWDGSPGGIFVRATLANGRTLTFGANDPPEPVTQR